MTPLPPNSVTLTLPYPPTTNNAYAVQRGRLVKTDAARDYATKVQAELLKSREARAFKRALAKGARFRVRIEVFPPDRRRRDLANVEKLCVDAVFGWLGADDCRIDHLELTRAGVVKEGRLVVTITPLVE